MKKYLLILLLVLGLLIVGCGGNGATNTPVAEPVVAEPVVAEPEPVVAEPTAVPEEEPVIAEPAVATAEDLDVAYNPFLGSMTAYNTITIDALNEALVEESPFILDVRNPSELEENGWIEGAVNIPLRELADNLEYLPSFDTPIVSYCGSGWRCTIALTMLEALGWEDVKGLVGGSFGGWVSAGYPIAEGELPEMVALNAAEPNAALVDVMRETLAAMPEGYGMITNEVLDTELVEKPDLIVIDVRTPGEVENNGYMDAPNLVFVPLEEMITMRADWPADKDAEIVVYCGSGHRSTIAMTILWTYGYTDVRSLRGGFRDWAAAGLPSIGVPEPVEEEPAGADLDAAFNTFLADMTGYNTISVDDFNLLLVEDNPPFILDVREPSELEANGWIEGAVNIPLRQVADNLEYLPSFDTPIVSYCGSGWRCTIALTALEALGWEDVRGLTGGSFGGWVAAGYPIVEGELPELVALNAAEPDPALVAEIQAMLQAVPDGFGMITADDLFLAQADDPDLILIDVRRQDEVEANGVIESENLIWVPLEEFVTMKDMWPTDLDAPIVVYCGSGHRSTIAMTILWSYGYTDVRSMRGGFAAWSEAGYPVGEYVAP